MLNNFNRSLNENAFKPSLLDYLQILSISQERDCISTSLELAPKLRGQSRCWLWIKAISGSFPENQLYRYGDYWWQSECRLLL